MKAIITAVAAMIAVGSQAELLATVSVDSYGGFTPANTPTEFGVSLLYQGDYETETIDFYPFTENDIGITREHHRSDPSWGLYEGLVNFMTNGEDDLMWSTCYIYNGGYKEFFMNPIASESSVLGSSHSSLNNIDLAGRTIESISFTLEEASISKNGPYDHIQYAGTFSFYGESIPEPSVLVLGTMFPLAGVFIRRFFYI